MGLNPEIDEIIEPPIQTLYFL